MRTPTSAAPRSPRQPRNRSRFPNCRLNRISAWLPLGALAWLLIAPAARAILPEPDNLVYGTVVVAGQPVTASHTTFQVEARRTGGQVVARYRMGANPGLGDFYALRLPIEAALPLLNPLASLPGDPLTLILTDPDGDIAQLPFLTGSRGTATRADFEIGIPHEDSDGNGLPDAWELLHFGAIGQNPDALNPNGQSTWQNYLAGTDPADLDSRFEVAIEPDGDSIVVSFLARAAEGAGYEGRTRHYALETSESLDQDWSMLPDLTDLPGNHQLFFYQHPADAAPGFFRVRVWLEP